MKRNYEQPKLRIQQEDEEDVITASDLSMGDDDYGKEDIFHD